MQFFIPNTSKAHLEATYLDISKSLSSQFRLPIEDRRIFSLNYTNSKRKWHAEVGKLEEQEHKYEIYAIFESKQFIVFTRAKAGGPGLTILIDKAEVTAVEDFAQAAS